MASSNSKRIPIAILVILAVAAAGYVIGSQGAKWVRDRKAEQYRAESTAAAVAQMNDTLRVGNQLPDNEFHNLRGGTSKLSDLVGKGAVIAYLRSSCGKCRQEMQQLARGVQGERQSRVIILSDSDPQSILDLADELKLTCPLLLDYKSQYRKRLGIWVFPFNIIVNDSMVIENMIADCIRSREFAEFTRNGVDGQH